MQTPASHVHLYFQVHLCFRCCWSMLCHCKTQTLEIDVPSRRPGQCCRDVWITQSCGCFSGVNVLNPMWACACYSTGPKIRQHLPAGTCLVPCRFLSERKQDRRLLNDVFSECI